MSEAPRPPPGPRAWRRRSAPPLFLLLAASACAGPRNAGPAEWGNPDGYRVHWLSGDSLRARAVAVNGIAVDTASVEAIGASVEAIIDSGSGEVGALAPRVVELVSGRTPEAAVDFTAQAPPVPATFHGADLQWRSKYFLANPRWRALIAHMRLDLLRFPAGQERVRYDRAATSGTVAEDTLQVAPDQPYEYRITGEDVAAFIGLCKDLGIAAEPEVNLTVDDPAMWAGMLDQIVNELGYDLRYVSVGNEPDIPSPNGNWPYLGAPGANTEADRQTAMASYLERWHRYHAALSAVRPGIIYAFAELGMWSPAELGKNLDAVLSGLGGDRPGAVSGHWYMLGNYGQPASSPDFPSVEHLVAEGNGRNDIAYLDTIAETLRARAAANGQAGARIFLGEWGVSWSGTTADAEVADRLAAALFNAEAQERGKTAGLDAMQWFGLSDPAEWKTWVPSLIAVDAEGTPRPRPQWYVYLLYRYLWGDRIVPVEGGRRADWSIHAARGGERSYLMLVNRTEASTFTPVVAVRTAAGDRQLRLTLYPHSLSIVSF